MIICVVLIARYIDGPEQSKSRWYENTHHTKRRTHQRSPRLHSSMIILPNSEKEASTMCVVLIGHQQEGHRTQHRTHQRSSRLQASMIMLPDGEKEASTTCVVFIGCQQEGPWRRKHAEYLDIPEQSQSRWYENYHNTQRRTHQSSPRLQAAIIML